MGTRLSGTPSPPAPRVKAPAAAAAPHARRSSRTGPRLGSAPRPRRARHGARTAFSFLLRFSTLRRAARVATLLALDFAGVSLAIFTALLLKEAVHGTVDATNALHGTEAFLPFCYLLTALLFANAGLYAERGMRPGMTRIVGSLFEVALVALIFALVNGEHFSSYYLFYGSLVFAIFYVSAFRAAYDRVTLMLLRAAGFQRRAVLVGRGRQIADVAHALADAPHSSIEIVGFLSPTPLPDNGLRSLGTLEDLGARARLGARRRGDHRRPRLPPGDRRRARRPVPPARHPGAPGALDDGDPDPPRRVRPGPVACRCSSSARPPSRASTSR